MSIGFLTQEVECFSLAPHHALVCFLVFLSRILALMLDCGISYKLPPVNREFICDLAWLKNEHFIPAVKNIWEKPVNSNDVIDILNRFKKYFKGWRSNIFGHNRKIRQELQTDLLVLESLEEHTALNMGQHM